MSGAYIGYGFIPLVYINPPIVTVLILFFKLINLHPFHLTTYITHHPHFLYWKCVGSSAADLSRHILQQEVSIFVGYRKKIENYKKMKI